MECVRTYVRGFLGFRLFLEFSWENDYRGWIKRAKKPRYLDFKQNQITKIEKNHKNRCLAAIFDYFL